MENLRVRLYGVRFGDAILISVPDRTSRGRPITRHILVDVGNVLAGEGGQDVVFRPILENVRQLTGGKPLDLYILTHEHLDHAQGLFYGAEKLGIELKARYAWLTASAAEDYYERFPEAKKRRDVYQAILGLVQASPELRTPWIDALLLNNNPAAIDACVAHLRQIAPAQRTSYVYRGCQLRRRHPFRDARFEVWAPEEDTSEYYGRFRPMSFARAQAMADQEGQSVSTEPLPPPGVDTGAFYDLVDIRRSSFVDNLLAIDYAANNTSIVFLLEWKGWRLLFPGDAEHRSWKTMDKHGQLRPVHFLKASHHGSANGVPPADLLQAILPVPAPDARPRHAVVSTYPDTYQHVPDRELLRLALEPRCELYYVDKGVVGDGEWLDVEFMPRE